MIPLAEHIPGHARVSAFGEVPLPPCAATVGNYDGLHRGHQAVLTQVVQAAQAQNLASVLLTFEPSPAEHFHGSEAPPRLSSLADKARLIEEWCPGLDHLVVLPFDAHLAQMPAQTFIEEILCGALKVRYLTVGNNFRFGYQRQGNTALLEAEAARRDFEFTPTALVSEGEERISSTRIRAALADGNLQEAEALLGHPYAITASVVRGEQRGQEFGFPTANLDFPHNPPLRGVFAVSTDWGGSLRHGVANIGTRPTVQGTRLTLEVHLLDFDGDLYEQTLTVRFHVRLRAERRFDSVDQLRAQIERDVRSAREHFLIHAG